MLHQADRHNIPFLASALTFDGLLAAIPFLLLLLVALTHLAALSSGGSTAQDLHQLFQRFVPPGADINGAGPFAAIEKFLVGFTRARATVSYFALPLFLWFATRLFASIRTSLTLVYDAPRRPGRHFVLSYLTGKVRDMMMVLLTVALLTVNAGLTAVLKVFSTRSDALGASLPWLKFFVSGLGQILTQFTTFAFAVSLFYLVYRHASPKRLPRLAAVAASIFVALLFEVAKRLYGWYLVHMAVVNRFSADASTGAALLFVVWMYYTALVFLIGAVVGETWDLLGRQKTATVQLTAETIPSSQYKV